MSDTAIAKPSDLVTAEDDSESQADKGGRPTKYRPDYANIAQQMCLLGATDADLARAFEVDTVTIWRWRSKHPEFCSALKVGKEQCDDMVERGLYQRAVGYSFDSEKIFSFQGGITRAKTVEHCPPDPGAAKLWLTNRRPEEWRDKVETQHNHLFTFSEEFEKFIRTINVEKDAKVIDGSLAEAGGGVGGASPSVRSGSSERNT